jgi:hypothetical protein
MLSLPRYLTSGDTAYVGKMNNTQQLVEDAVNVLQAAIGAAAPAAVTLSSLLPAEFGSVTAIIGSASYVPTGSGSNLTVTAGFAYVPSASVIVQTLTSTVLSFTGLGAATYYVNVDSTGAITEGAAGANSLWSVVWTGSAFGAITRVAPYYLNSADYQALYTSTALSTTYATVRARFEAIEAASLLVGLGTLVTYATAAGAVNNANPGGGFPAGISGLDVTLGSGAANWTGLLAGSDGQRVSISNQDATNILTLNSQNAGSTAANRFSAAADMALVPGQTLGLVYRAGSINRWRIVG